MIQRTLDFNATVATYEMDYGGGKVIGMGLIWTHTNGEKRI